MSTLPCETPLTMMRDSMSRHIWAIKCLRGFGLESGFQHQLHGYGAVLRYVVPEATENGVLVTSKVVSTLDVYANALVFSWLPAIPWLGSPVDSHSAQVSQSAMVHSDGNPIVHIVI